MPESTNPAGPNTLLRDIERTDFDSFANDAGARSQTLAAARALVRRLETPIESMWEMTYNHPLMYACCKVAVDRRVFNKLEEAGGGPKTTSQLAAESTDPAMLRRLLRHLAAMHVIREVDVDRWEGTRLSKSLRTPGMIATVDYMNDITIPAFMSLPKFLAKTGYKNPADRMGNWQFATDSQVSHFAWLEQHPEAMKTFSNLMTAYASQRGSWLEVYPTASLLETADSDGDILVDVGGGLGHDLKKFLEKHPHSAGRLVLQDLASVIADAQKQDLNGIKPIAHDFFTIQPRKVLINELVINDRGADRHQSSFDLTMMALFSSGERTEKQWTEFLESAGYKIVKIWGNSSSLDSVIEIECM
ncbi:MAG: hypothetical protein Q9159_005945 [Coniocarpon cinnabarinum]